MNTLHSIEEIYAILMSSKSVEKIDDDKLQRYEQLKEQIKQNENS